jgi:hypothetical protein
LVVLVGARLHVLPGPNEQYSGRVVYLHEDGCWRAGPVTQTSVRRPSQLAYLTDESGPYIAVFTPVPAIDHPLGGRSRFRLP